jgi:aminopeptidase N
MFRTALRPMLLAAALLAPRVSAHEMFCAGMLRGAAPIDSPAYRKYAPDRFVDVLHMVIEVTPDFKTRSVAGTTTLTFKPLNELTELRLNARDLRVSGVTGSSRVRHFDNTGSELIITFAEPLPAGREQEVAITYEAFPRKGLYFRTQEMGYHPEDEHLFTQGEDTEARHWFPCYDSPNDKFTNELICHIPEGMTALSNGKLLSESPGAEGLKVARWLQDKPHPSYLISLVAGNFKKIEDKYGNIPLAFYTPASQIDLAQNSFAETKEMMEFFENEIGVPYPWDKYYQVCVQDFMWGGMENTSITTLTDNTLFPEETENIQSSQGLVAHELAHQWFGDLVTCEDWSQIWLNEGFATYYAHLYQGHKDGRDAFLYGMRQSARQFINKSAAEDSRPVVFRKYDQPLELFGYLVYPKGGWILHMLRHELGEDLFRKCIRAYLERHKFDTVDTHDLINVVEELSGRSFDQFFDQWVFHPHHPELQVRYEWEESKKLAIITVNQTQPLTNDVSLFRFPLTLRFKSSSGTTERTVEVKEKQEQFFIPLDAAPKTVRIDPDYNLLAKISFEPPRQMVVEQLKDGSDMMGRIHAVEQLSKSSDQGTIDLIAERLNKDSFYGVRVEAANALRKIHTKEALRALMAAASQEDARVRHAVTRNIAEFYEEEAWRFARGVLEKEKNPEIRAVAIRSLNASSAPEDYELLLKEIKSDSFQNLVAAGAIAAARAQNDARYVEPIIEALRSGTRRFTARGFANGLDAVAYLGRHETNKNAAYEVLTKYVGNPRQAVRVGAIRALGTLRDERALAVLENFSSGPDDAPETREAKRAVEAIRSQRPVVNEVNGLRTEILELKKQNEEFKKSLEELKKRTSAVPEPKKTTRRSPLRSGK